MEKASRAQVNINQTESERQREKLRGRSQTQTNKTKTRRTTHDDGDTRGPRRLTRCRLDVVGITFGGTSVSFAL